MVKRLNCYPANRKKNEEKKNNRKDFYSFLTPTKAKSIYIIFEEYCQETHQIWSFLAKNEEKKEGRFVVRWKLKKEKKTVESMTTEDFILFAFLSSTSSSVFQILFPFVFFSSIFFYCFLFATNLISGENAKRKCVSENKIIRTKSK